MRELYGTLSPSFNGYVFGGSVETYIAEIALRFVVRRDKTREVRSDATA